ncbi:hypothetical protein CEXT_754841 [Caerostris extrusa]|uniref:Uncharacterized protein n=1 Tax=Caerostris extrusa TaxID=172846 RepID=A0AAV4SLL4_CAEEX|nr:hypothetical protein CEXT_754841 [Caerostris extrusa]
MVLRSHCFICVSTVTAIHCHKLTIWAHNHAIEPLRSKRKSLRPMNLVLIDTMSVGEPFWNGRWENRKKSKDTIPLVSFRKQCRKLKDIVSAETNIPFPETLHAVTRKTQFRKNKNLYETIIIGWKKYSYMRGKREEMLFALKTRSYDYIDPEIGKGC